MSPRNEEQNQQIRDERCEQILRAALSVFAQKGLSAAKIGDIASAAGLSHGLVYHYFKSKDAIFTALVSQALDISLMLIKEALKAPGSPLERIQTVIETLIPNAYREVGPYYFLLMIQAFTSDAVPREAKTLAAEKGVLYVSTLVPVIEEGQRSGEIISDDPGRLATTFFALIQGLAVSQIQVPDENLLPTADMILRLFKAGVDKAVEAPSIQPTESQSNPNLPAGTGIFGPVLLKQGTLNYRMRTGLDKAWTQVRSSVEKVVESGLPYNRIEEWDESSGKTVALVRPGDWRPVRVESYSLQGDPVSVTDYLDHQAVLQKSGQKGKKSLNLRDNSYDMTTLNGVFRAYPFGRREKVEFDVVMDGRYGAPVGVFPMTLRFLGRETVTTPAGDFECYRLELGVGGTMAIFAAKYKYDFWYTVDEPRFLVKYQDREGNLMELTGEGML